MLGSKPELVQNGVAAFWRLELATNSFSIVALIHEPHYGYYNRGI